MNSFWGPVVFVLIFAVVILALIFSNVQRAKLLQRLAELSRLKGWQFVSKPGVYVDCSIQAQQAGVSWELRYINKERSHFSLKAESVESIVWFSSQAATRNGSCVLYPRLGKLPANPRLANMDGLSSLANGLLANILQASGVDISGASVQTAGSPEFQSRYMVMAPDGATAQRLAAVFEPYLLSWPRANSPMNLPSVIINSSGTTIRVVRNSTSLKFQCQMAEDLPALGTAMVQAMK